jgi:tripartite-type tricarboxylate transporter receptor subunit TctC
MKVLLRSVGILGVVLTTALAPAHAQSPYPTRNITMVVPFAAGGTSDVLARIVAEQMGAILGQRIINENVAGAGGSTALARVARAEPDGYTITIGNAGTNAATYTINTDLTFKPDAFVAVAMIAKTFGLVAIKKDHPAKTLKEFIAHAKANPGKVTLGHAGIGSSNYLICQTFVKAAGIDVTLVGYRGAGPALNDLVGGQIDGVCDTATSLSGPILSNQVNGIVSGSTVRLPTLPNVPTAAEAGLPEFESQGWNALFVPKSTPDAVIAKLNEAARKALASEAVVKRFGELSSVIPSADEQTQAFIVKLVPDEIEKFRKLLAK